MNKYFDKNVLEYHEYIDKIKKWDDNMRGRGNMVKEKTTMNDCISRQEAIKIIEHRRKQNPMKSIEFIQGMQDAYLRILSDIKALPPVAYNDDVNTRSNNND